MAIGPDRTGLAQTSRESGSKGKIPHIRARGHASRASQLIFPSPPQGPGPLHGVASRSGAASLRRGTGVLGPPREAARLPSPPANEPQVGSPGQGAQRLHCPLASCRPFLWNCRQSCRPGRCGLSQITRGVARHRPIPSRNRVERRIIQPQFGRHHQGKTETSRKTRPACRTFGPLPRLGIQGYPSYPGRPDPASIGQIKIQVGERLGDKIAPIIARQ